VLTTWLLQVAVVVAADTKLVAAVQVATALLPDLLVVVHLPRVLFLYI
jgi:hypothetical protein